MAVRSGVDILERQVVQTLIANTTGPMKKELANTYCLSITVLYEVTASMKENVQEFQETKGIIESVYHVQVEKQKQWDQSPQMQDYRQNGIDKGNPS